MSTRKLTLRTESFQRASDQVMVLGANPVNDDITPKNIIPSESIFMANSKYVVFKSSAGSSDSYIFRAADDSLYVANLKAGEDLLLVTTMASGNQRAIIFGEYGATDTVELFQDYGFVIRTSSGDLSLLPGGEIYVTPYERHIQIPAILTGNPANQPTAVDFFTAGGLQFATTGAKYAFFQWELPDDWDGTDVYIEVDWFPDSAAMSGTDTVQWTIEYRCTAEGEIHGAGTSKTLTLTNSDDNARYFSVHSRGTMPYNDANQPLSKQDHIYFKMSRNTAVANDFGGTVTVPAFEIIYNSNKLPRSN